MHQNNLATEIFFIYLAFNRGEHISQLKILNNFRISTYSNQFPMENKIRKFQPHGKLNTNL